MHMKFIFFCALVITANLFTNPLVYKRGFIFSLDSPRVIPESYQQINEHLWVEKSLMVTISADENCILLGFCVDIEEPHKSLQSIADQLSTELKNSEKSFFKYSYNLCGRYAILYSLLDQNKKIITDAVGFRPVYHNASGSLITSHARLLAVNLGIQEIPLDIRQLDKSLLPQRTTQFEGVFHLNPNEYLVIGSGKTVRFFPQEALAPISKKEVLSQLSYYVSNAIMGLLSNQEKPVLFSLTGGADSRATLAIIRQYNLNIDQSYTYIKPNEVFSRDSADANRLCKKYRIQHKSVRPSTEPIPAELLEALLSNPRYSFRDLTDSMVLGIWETFSTDQFIHLNSNVAELWKRYNTNPPYNHTDLIYRASHFGIMQEDIYNYNLGTFILWEHQMTEWMTDVWVYMDVVFDTFCPYNSRKIINLMLQPPLDFPGALDIHYSLINQL